MAVPAHPADLAAGIADHQRVVRNVLGHDRAGADERVAADGDAADDRGVGADRAAALAARVVSYSECRFTCERGFVTLVSTHDGPRNTSSSTTTPV